MNLIQWLQLITEIQSIVSELQADGTLGKIESAIAAGEAEFQKPQVSSLFAKLKTLGAAHK